MIKSFAAVMLVAVALSGCYEKDAPKTDPAPVQHNVTINNPPASPVQNTTIIHDRTVVHDQATAAPVAAPPAATAPPAQPAGNITINNNNANPSASPS